jgi:hypothetical protein
MGRFASNERFMNFSMLNLITFLAKPRGPSQRIHNYLLATSKRKRIYLILTMAILLIELLVSIAWGIFSGWIMNQSLIHNPENDMLNYSSGIIITLFLTSPFTYFLVLKVIAITKQHIEIDCLGPTSQCSGRADALR